MKGEQVIHARDVVLILGRVLDVVMDQVADRETLGHIIDRIEREIMLGPERLEKRANKPWLR